MNSKSIAPAQGFAGRYHSDKGQWAVTLRPVGEHYEIVSLDADAGEPVIDTYDRGAYAAEFTVPRAGVDRYPDWASYEWNTRLPDAARFHRSVWRIAQNAERATFLGLASPVDRTAPSLPLAAALWRGWSRRGSMTRRALFWNADCTGHLWILRPFDPPRYIRVGKQPSAEEIVCAVAMVDDPARVVLEVGGVGLEFWRALTAAYPGRTCQTEPYSDYLVGPSVREQILGAVDPTVYMPALGAARALAEGAPAVMNLCGSSPEHSADAV